MGLEAYIRDVLEEAGRPFDYWFENGLKADNILVANEIVETLNETGKFSPAYAVFDKAADAWCVEFKSPLKKRKEKFDLEHEIHKPGGIGVASPKWDEVVSIKSVKKKVCIDCGDSFYPPVERPRARKCDDCYWAPVGP